MASIDVRYYELIGRVLTSDRLSLKQIGTIWKQLQNLKDQKKSAAVSAALPKWNKTAAFTTWSKVATAFLDGNTNVRNTPMFYLICYIVYPKIIPQLIANKPYSYKKKHQFWTYSLPYIWWTGVFIQQQSIIPAIGYCIERFFNLFLFIVLP